MSSKLSTFLVVLLAIAMTMAAPDGARQRCGAKLLFALDAVCPHGCENEAYNFAEYVCTTLLTMEDLKNVCCPSA
ncbi:unnamed protein product [Caenorhabditis nigoni]